MKSNSNKMVHVQINVDTCHTRAHNTITIPVYMTYIIWLQLINCAWICFSRCNIGYFNCHDELVVSGATWPGPAHCDRQLKALHDNGIDTWLWSGVNYQDLNLDPRIGAEGWEIPALHDYAVQFLFKTLLCMASGPQALLEFILAKSLRIFLRQQDMLNWLSLPQSIGILYDERSENWSKKNWLNILALSSALLRKQLLWYIDSGNLWEFELNLWCDQNFLELLMPDHHNCINCPSFFDMT